MKQTISIRLFDTLRRGKERLSGAALQRVADFVESQRTEEESFMDKSGKADLYYTVFGWMLCYVLGAGTDAKKCRAYLESIDADDLDLIHYAAYVRCRLLCELFENGRTGLLLGSVFPRRVKALGDFKGIPHGDPSSPYTRFIWLSLLEDTGHRIRYKRTILESLKRYRADSGGYMNTTDGLTAATNATAAALAVKGQTEGYNADPDAEFLRGLQQPSGGFGAADASPVPDLLSTATALFVLDCYGLEPKYPAREFVEAHWLDSGGFSGTLLDDKSDIEYTFYGLLALGAINNEVL